MLKKEFCLKYKRNINFFSILNNIITHNTIKQFLAYTIGVIKYLDYIYCYCSCFINFVQLKHISKKDFIIMVVFNIDILYYQNINYCGHNFKLFDFCYKYLNCVKEN